MREEHCFYVTDMHVVLFVVSEAVAIVSLCAICKIVFRLSPLILNVVISLIESMQKCRLLVLLFIFIVSFNLILLFS